MQRGPRNRIPDALREDIAAALRRGVSVRETARRFDVAPSTVSTIAREQGVDTERARTKKAEAARLDYDCARRLELLNTLFAKATTLANAAADGRDFRDIVVAVGVLIDKRRLEDGEVTDRVDVHNGGARERLVSRLDELAERRRAKDALSRTERPGSETA